jgi:antitoxin MazE
MRKNVTGRAGKKRRKIATPGALTTKLVQIGNSRGIRLPKAVIEQAGLTDRVTIMLQGGRIVLAAAERNPRAGWEEQIKAALAEHGDDVDDWAEWQNMPNAFDEKDWTW